MESDSPVAQAFVDALVRHDFHALEATLAPTLRFRALVPGETVDALTAAEAAACFERWFRDKTDIELIDRHVDVLVDKLQFGFRARVMKKGRPHVVEQRLCGEVDNGRFARLDLLCTGFRPEAAPPTHDRTHVFDAGDLGCGSGLPREFRTRIAQIPVGDVLEVVTADPSAKEDLPSMARLLGQHLLSVEPRADGKVSIRVERSK